MRTTTEVFEDHLQRRLRGDVEGDVRTNYVEGVVLITGTGTFKGCDGVRESASQLEKYSGKNATFEYKHTVVEGSYAFLEWTSVADDTVVGDGADSFVIQDGKIIFQ